MSSRFLLQIVDRKTNAVIQIEPGLAAEKAFVDDVVERLGEMKVGVGRTKATVAECVRTALELAILDLKTQVRADV